MTSIRLTVNGANASAMVTGKLTSGMVGIPVTIEYDRAWDGLTKNLICRCTQAGSGGGESRAILNVGESATVAHEVMQANTLLYLGVEGFSSDGKLVIPTVWAICASIDPGANTCEDPTADPELSVWNQLQTELEQIKSGRSGLYYTPVVSQPAGDTLKFEFLPSVSGATAPEPVVVQLPVGGGGPQGLDLTVETITVGEGSDGPVAVTGIALDYTSLSLRTGDMMQLAAMVTPDNATNSAVVWETSNSSLVTVSDGLVTAKSEGSAVITAKSVDNPSIKATCTVTVVAAENGEGSSSGVAGDKIQLSTHTLIPGAIKKNGTVAEISNFYYADIPYTDGMFVSVAHGQSNDNSGYAAMLVYEGETFTVPEYTIGTECLNFGSARLAYQTTATLTGYQAGSTVRVSVQTKAVDKMDEDGIYYYIPGGEN